MFVKSASEVGFNSTLMIEMNGLFQVNDPFVVRLEWIMINASYWMEESTQWVCSKSSCSLVRNNDNITHFDTSYR